MRGSLTTTRVALRELRPQPRAQLGAHRRVVRTAAVVLARGRARVVDGDAARAHQAPVEVDDPVRLAEAARVGVVGVDLRLGDVEAELAEHAREQARAAAAHADDEDQALRRCALIGRPAPSRRRPHALAEPHAPDHALGGAAVLE